MKTRNSNLKETTVKSLSIFTTVFVTVLAISANTLAGNTNSDTGSLANLLTDEKDVESNVEEWMLNENSFEYHFNLKEATEEGMEVENRMLEDSLFSKKDKAKAKEKSESEKEGEVLAEVNTDSRKKAVGVTSQKTQFGRRAMILIEDVDPKLKMEQWMVDYRHWKTK